MKFAELKQLGLDDETAKKVEEAQVEELKGYIPKNRFDEVNNEKKALELNVKERDIQLENLKKSTGDIEGMKKQIETLQSENKAKNEAHAAEVKTLKVENAITTALTASGAKNIKAVRALLDLEKSDIGEDGTIKGLDDQIKKLQGAEDAKFLFATSDKKKPVIKGASPAETGVEDADTKVDVSKMSYEELASFMENNPETKI